MVAMLLVHGSQLTVSPLDGDDESFDLDTEQQAAIALLLELREAAANRGALSSV
jgi:hypothetical protein